MLFSNASIDIGEALHRMNYGSDGLAHLQDASHAHAGHAGKYCTTT